jgi:hypothetical protein
MYGEILGTTEHKTIHVRVLRLEIPPGVLLHLVAGVEQFQRFANTVGW